MITALPSPDLLASLADRCTVGCSRDYYGYETAKRRLDALCLPTESYYAACAAIARRLGL